MNDYAPPTGPPPPAAPEVPAGWTARWNDQYKAWFYVNIYTKKSQWDKPTEPVYPQDDDAPPGAPPGYTPGSGPAPSDVKHNPYEEHAAPGSSSSRVDEDARYAAQLQAEEDARARNGPGGPNPGYGGSQSGSQYPQNLPPREQKKSGGLFGKLLGKASSSSSSRMGGAPHYGAPGGYGGHQGGYAPQPGYGGYPQQPGYPQQHGYAQPGYGGYPQQHGYAQPGYGGYPQQQYGRPQRSGGGGMGMAGGAALGLGAGLIGGALVADAINDNEQEAYADGYDDGGGGEDFGGDE